jgi:hypothetical protein
MAPNLCSGYCCTDQVRHTERIDLYAFNPGRQYRLRKQIFGDRRAQDKNDSTELVIATVVGDIQGSA